MLGLQGDISLNYTVNSVEKSQGDGAQMSLKILKSLIDAISAVDPSALCEVSKIYMYISFT